MEKSRGVIGIKMADRSRGDQDQKENGKGEKLKKKSYPINHQKRNEEEVDRLLATVSHEFKKITINATEELGKENADLRKRLIESDTERLRYQNETDKLRKQFQEEKKLTTQQEVKLRTEIEKLKQINDQKEREWTQRLKESEEIWAQRLKESEEISDKIALSKLNVTENERDETKPSYLKLKKAYDDKFTKNDPSMAELSDKYRPTKLAEKFSELYDNQWTDAYEEIERYFGTEEDTIQVLLEILMDVMRFCEQRARLQMEKLQNELTCSDDPTVDSVPDVVTKQLKNLRKVLATPAKDNLYQIYISIIKTSTDENRRYVMKIEPFVKECFEICWFMAIQDPPIVLCASSKSGDSLNTNLYRHYTTSGRYIKYMVWPAMLLHESGPVLAKGIAQGTNEKKELRSMVGDKPASDDFTTKEWNIYDFKNLYTTTREESHKDSYTRDIQYISSGEDRHHQRSKSAEASRQFYKQSAMGLDLKPNTHTRRHNYDRHPTAEEMRRFFYRIERRNYSGAQSALGNDI